MHRGPLAGAGIEETHQITRSQDFSIYEDLASLKAGCRAVQQRRPTNPIEHMRLLGGKLSFVTADRFDLRFQRCTDVDGEVAREPAQPVGLKR